MNLPIHSFLFKSLLVLVVSVAGFSSAKSFDLRVPTPVQAIQTASASPQSPDLAEAVELSSKVLKLYGERKFEEALPLAKRALELREKALSADHQLVINAQINLAEVYMALGKHRSAESPLQRAVASYRTADPNDVRLADILERLALLQYGMGETRKSESAYEESLRIREKVFGVDSAKSAQPLLMLAELHQLEGNEEKAATFYKRVISIREKETGSNNEQLVDAIGRYVCFLGKMGQKEETEKWRARLATFYSKESPGSLNSKAGSPNEAFSKGGVLNGKAIHLPAPEYPAEARSARLSGLVVVEVWIDESGRVQRACAISGPAKLRRASEVAAYQARFSPTKLSGQPVKVRGLLTYNYVTR